MDKEILDSFVKNALREDVGDGDHSSLACFSPDTAGIARLLIKEQGVFAGAEVTREILARIDPMLRFTLLIEDGTPVKKGDIGFEISGSVLSILKSERLILNVLQRMSGIATTTRTYVDQLEGLETKVLDTRKTTPGFRHFEKMAVRIGGGENHRMGLYDMIMLKDNHIDFCGGIVNAISKTHDYLRKTGKILRIEIEAHSLENVKKILAIGGIHRIMLDNFTIEETREAVRLIAGRFETESSGGITLKTVRAYAECGVDYISVGALTHSVKSLDMSMNATH